MRKINISKYDLPLLAAVLALVLVGILMVFSSSAVMADIKWSTPYAFIIKQLLWVVLGLLGMGITAFYIDYRLYQKYARFLYLAIFIVLILVLIFGVVRGGAKRWFYFGFFTVQPSEIAKVIIIMAIADFISRKKKELYKPQSVIGAILLVTIIIIPIALEPDLGAPILIFIISFTMLFCAGVNMKAIAIAIGAALLFVIEESIRESYRFGRLKNYLLSLTDINSASYQLKQSINALGSGGITGKGLGKSELKLMYLPEAHTDFIFPILGEEFGFIGAFVVIALFTVIFIRGIKISKNAPDLFSKYLALGITLLITIQTIINLLVATGLFPTKGLVLPFISFGGTAMIVNLSIVGILINLSKYNSGKY
jgi:cell division protein FtsW